MMFTYDLSDVLRKRLRKLAKKDKVLAISIRNKITEIVSCDSVTISRYKNLKSPQNEFKRIHITKSHILLFRVDIASKFILFVDILHWDEAYS